MSENELLEKETDEEEPELTPEEMEFFHACEIAAPCVVIHQLGEELLYVSLPAKEEGIASTSWGFRQVSPRKNSNLIACCGLTAMNACFHDDGPIWGMRQTDLRELYRFADSYVAEGKIKPDEIIEVTARAFKAAVDIMKPRNVRQTVYDIAHELVEKRKIEGDELHEMIDKYLAMDLPEKPSDNASS